MRPIVYYVATSIDGFICGSDGDISGFLAEGSGVDQYLSDLQNFDTVIMGRKTYEFGYDYGLKPGAKAYPHMKHYIFSNTLVLPQKDPELMICKLDAQMVRSLKNQDGTDIYMCGGGQFASWLLQHQLLDKLKIKFNPFIQGKGIRIFEPFTDVYQLKLVSTQLFDHGFQLFEYDIQY